MRDNNNSSYNVSCVHISKEAQECNATTVNIVLPPAVSPKLRISEVFPNELVHKNEKFSFTGEYFFMEELQGWLGIYDVDTSCSTFNYSRSLMMLIGGPQSVPKTFDAETYYALFGSKRINTKSTTRVTDSSTDSSTDEFIEY